MNEKQRAEIKARVERAHGEVGDITYVGAAARWRVSVPARPDHDSDLIITAALNDTWTLLAEVERLRALWAAVAKDSRQRGKEAQGRKAHGERLAAENERLRTGLAKLAAEWEWQRDEHAETISRIPGAVYEQGKRAVYDRCAGEIRALMDGGESG